MTFINNAYGQWLVFSYFWLSLKYSNNWFLTTVSYISCKCAVPHSSLWLVVLQLQVVLVNKAEVIKAKSPFMREVVSSFLIFTCSSLRFLCFSALFPPKRGGSVICSQHYLIFRASTFPLQINFQDHSGSSRYLSCLLCVIFLTDLSTLHVFCCNLFSATITQLSVWPFILTSYLHRGAYLYYKILVRCAQFSLLVLWSYEILV